MSWWAASDESGVGVGKKKKISPAPSAPDPQLAPTWLRWGTVTSVCAHACLYVPACVCASQNVPPQGEVQWAAALVFQLAAWAPTRSFLGFPTNAPSSVRSLFVLASDKWRAFYTGKA